jgi:release factor glutamine methyltransferase
MHTRWALREAIDAAARTLADAGVDSARANAEELAAHVAGVDRGRLALLAEAPHDFWGRYRELVEARSRRIPLQHLTGLAAFGPLLLRVGPGVFVPRPETESLLDWALGALKSVGVQTNPIIVDVCTGTGALALALAHHRPDATVIAIDDSAEALRYAARNAAGTAVELVSADVTEPGLLPHLDGRVDLVISNPPYIPDGAHLEPEVAEHDPHEALFGGPDGMTVIGAVIQLAARWLRPGGLFAVEHDDTTSGRTAELVANTGSFDDITRRTDLAGRPRFVTAVRLSGQEGDSRS